LKNGSDFFELRNLGYNAVNNAALSRHKGTEWRGQPQAPEQLPMTIALNHYYVPGIRRKAAELNSLSRVPWVS
jgi:hypothetical protein